MAYPILGNPKPAFFDSSGSPLASGTITVQNPSDSAAKNSYPTADDADADTNGTSSAITLDSRGEPSSTQLWGRDGEDYKIIVADSDATTIYTIDDIRLPGPSRRALATAASADASPSVASQDMIKLNDTDINSFDDGQVGDILYVFGPDSGEVVVSSNSNIWLNEELDFGMLPDDSLVLKMYEDGKWHEVGRSLGVSANRSYNATTAKTLVQGDHNKTFYLNSATGFALTLPSPAENLRFRFIVKTAPTSGGHTIVTASGANIIQGCVYEGDGTAAAAANEDTITFVASTSLVGDRVDLESDGTNWHMVAFTSAGGGITVSAT